MNITCPIQNKRDYRVRLNETFKRNLSPEFWCMPSENVTRSKQCIAIVPAENIDTDLFHKLNKKDKIYNLNITKAS